MGKHKDKGGAGKKADQNATVKLPNGKEVPLKNSSTGFFVSGAHYLQCAETMAGKVNPYGGQIEDGMPYGKRANNLPDKLWVSQNHGTPAPAHTLASCPPHASLSYRPCWFCSVLFAIQNNFYFVKDTSKQARGKASLLVLGAL